MSSFRFARRMRHLPLLWWLCTCAVAAMVGLVVTQVVVNAQARASEFETWVDVPIATRDIPAGSLVEAGDIELMKWPANLLPDSEITPEPVGSRASVALLKGEPLVIGKLSPSARSAIAAMLNDDERAIDTLVSSNGTNVQAGDLVDVLATYENTAGASVVAENARVLKVSESLVTVAVEAENIELVASAVVDGKTVLAVKN